MISIKNSTLICVSLLLCSACSNSSSHSEKVDSTQAKTSSSMISKKPVVSPTGEEITFCESDSSVAILREDSAGFRDISLTTTAPARIVFTTVGVESGVSGITPVFESSDMTQLYTDLTKARHDLDHFHHETERLQDLYAHNAVAGKEVTQAESDEVTARATLSGLESRMLTSGLSPAELMHPKANTSILIANVPENEIMSVQKGEDAQVEIDAYKGQVLHGRVLEIGHAIDPVTRTFNVRIELPNRDKILRPGMFAKVSFGIDVVKKFAIPERSVVSVQGKNYVFVATSDHTFERREVVIGQQAKENIVINNGLTPGERVVTDGAVLLKGLSFGS